MMKYFPVCLVVGCIFFSRGAWAGIESDIGLNFTPPSGWKLDRLTSKQIWMEDTTGRFGAIFKFTVYDKIDTLSENASDWVETQGLVRVIQLETHECFGFIWAMDTIQQDGLYSILVNAEEGDCLENATKVQIYRTQSRYVANGNFGWDLTVIADSADMVESYSLYIDFLDSIKIDRTFDSIPVRKTRAAEGKMPSLWVQKNTLHILSIPQWQPFKHTAELRIFMPNGRMVKKAFIDKLPFRIQLKQGETFPSIVEVRVNDGISSSRFSMPFIFQLR